MDIELKSEGDLAKAYQGRYEGVDVNLRRISNEVKARRGEYDGFGTYLRQIVTKPKQEETINKAVGELLVFSPQLARF